MLRGLWQLTWLEVKIFVREPLGAVGGVFFPVLAYVALGRIIGRRVALPASEASELVRVSIPVFSAILIALSSLISLVTIIAIYREGGILKRLRATPLRPWTILTAHVLVKLAFTAATLLLMVAAGRRYYPADLQIPVTGFLMALLVGTFSILSIGFVIASLVPTARFAQPITAVIVYPMIALSGVFVPIDALPAPLAAIANVVPLTYAVSLLRGILLGAPWTDHVTDLAGLAIVFAVCVALSARVFRWE